MMPNNDKPPIGLQELIMKVKQDLLSQPDDTQPLFVIEKVELEVSFTVDRTASGGIDFKVVQGDVEKTWGQVQKVKLVLDPILSRQELGPNLTLGEKHIVKEALQREAVDIE
jgi:hypothetical protein